jgi:Spy/CpxP family protein refolding chaperone
MNKQHWIAGVLAAAGLMGMTGCKSPSPEQQADWIVKKVTSKLDLNGEQEAKLRAVKEAYLDARKRHSATQREAREEIKQIVLSDALDAKRIRELMKKRNAIVDQEFDGVFGKVADFHASLTPDQRKEAVRWMEKFDSYSRSE